MCAAKHCEHIIHIVRRNSDGVIECVIGAVDVKIVALLGVHARQGLLLRETVAAADAPKAHGFIRKNGDHTAAKGRSAPASNSVGASSTMTFASLYAAISFFETR